MEAPRLVGTVGAINLVEWDRQVWTIPQALGPLDLTDDAQRGRPGIAAHEGIQEAHAAATASQPPAPPSFPVRAAYVPAQRGMGARFSPKAAGEWRFVKYEPYGPAEPPAPGAEGFLEFGCPRGDGFCGAIRIANGLKPPGEKTWCWNGSLDRPTLTPSINCLAHGPNGERYAGCGWHAHLTDGHWLAG